MDLIVAICSEKKRMHFWTCCEYERYSCVAAGVQ